MACRRFLTGPPVRVYREVGVQGRLVALVDLRSGGRVCSRRLLFVGIGHLPGGQGARQRPAALLRPRPSRTARSWRRESEDCRAISRTARDCGPPCECDAADVGNLLLPLLAARAATGSIWVRLSRGSEPRRNVVVGGPSVKKPRHSKECRCQRVPLPRSRVRSSRTAQMRRKCDV